MIPTRIKALEESIANNTYLRGCALEVAQQISQRKAMGEFAFIYSFSAQGNEKLNGCLVEYLKSKKYKVTDAGRSEHNTQRIKIAWH